MSHEKKFMSVEFYGSILSVLVCFWTIANFGEKHGVVKYFPFPYGIWAENNVVS